MIINPHTIYSLRNGVFQGLLLTTTGLDNACGIRLLSHERCVEQRPGEEDGLIGILRRVTTGLDIHAGRNCSYTTQSPFGSQGESDAVEEDDQ